jgi:hypothetical protein
MSKSKNDIAWKQIFEKHNILAEIAENGQIYISSTEINKFREARLMTKFDHKSQLPELFIANDLSILPTSRGGYVIANIETFHHFDEEEIEITKFEFPNFLESLDYKNITSETTAINCAFVSGILLDFTGEEELYPTVSGRMSSSTFDFNINSSSGLFNVNVVNSQVEIDGGYEGLNSLNLIEAKNYISDDFLVRQLYYPYKLWTNKIEKNVRLIFLTYTNGIFHLREYSFDDPSHYNSLKLIRQKKYTVQEGIINLETIQQILENVEIVVEPQIPFPQADSFERVINLCEILNEKSEITKEGLISDYGFIRGTTFDKRQINYYTDAGRYLGLVDKKIENRQIIYFLTEKGNNLFKLSIYERQLEFAKLILSHSVFKQTLELYFENGETPKKAEIVQIMKGLNLYNVNSQTTYFRRASTITSWINWIMNLIEE